MRYIIRKEFYGGFVYDRGEDGCMAIDDEFINLLQALSSGKIKIFDIDGETVEFLISEGFILENGINYTIVENGFNGETLSSPCRIHFYYTSKCNLNCKHCFSKDATNRGIPLTYEQKIKLLDEMKALGIYEILVGGGEPFVEPDFCDFVENALSRDIVVKVFSNGLSLTDEIIERMSKWNLRYFSISVDGKNDDEYFSTRGVRGIKILTENIGKIRAKCKFPVAVSITVNKYNYKDYAGYLQLLKTIGVDRVKVRPTKPSGNVYKNKDIYCSANEYLHFVKGLYGEWLKNYRDSFKIDVSWGDARIYYDEKDGCLKIVNVAFPYEGYGCFAGNASMVIDSHGYCTPCGFLPESMQFSESDNITKKSIKEIWDNGKKFTVLRNRRGNDECKACEYYGVCRGGCIARNLFENININEKDPWCVREYFPLKV